MRKLRYAAMASAVLLCASFKPFQQETTGLNLGNKAPEIVMKNPQGKEVRLSSLKGQLVLIDFWASWCGPCRYENPHVVKAYNLYRNEKFHGGKGFTVFSVSLDHNADAWQNAITKDSLTWPHHVSDLQGWRNAAAAKYNITSIPASFLINEKGVIIKKNLRGFELMRTLEELTLKK